MGLTSNAVDQNAGQRTTASEIVEWLELHRTNAMDIDGDGQTTALGDGILMLRYLARFEGDALIAGAVGVNATRKTSSEIEAWLTQFSRQNTQAGPIAYAPPVEPGTNIFDARRQDAFSQPATVKRDGFPLANANVSTLSPGWRELSQIEAIDRLFTLDEASSVTANSSVGYLTSSNVTFPMRYFFQSL